MAWKAEPMSMPPANLAQAWTDAVDVASVGEHCRFRVEAGRLRRGLFVTELDRPWLDTPFLIQGFLADSEIEVKTLKRYCRYVYVDLERSDPAVASAVRAGGRFDPVVPPIAAHDEADDGSPRCGSDETGAAALDCDTGVATADPAGEPITLTGAGANGTARPASAGRAYKVRADVRISPETRQRFRSLVRGVATKQTPQESEESLAQRALARVRGLFGSGDENGDRANGEARHAIPAEVARLLAPGTKTSFYEDRHDASTELPRARQAFTLADEALSALAQDIRAGRVPHLDQVGEAVDRTVESICNTPDALLWVVQMREESEQTYQQGVRVALYLITLGRQLGLPRPQLNALGMVGMLADIGKTRLPRALLDKPGMLNPAEYSIVKEHVRLGLEALSVGKPLAREVELGIAQHHERLDGSGYPKGLKGDEISLFGRMAAIADCFAALSAPRAYANPLAAQDALMSLYQWADTSFHGVLVEQFVQAIGVFPVGSLVELSSGEVAVVVSHHRLHRLEPKVLLLTWPDKRMLPTQIEIDLLNQSPVSGAKPLRVMRGLPSGAYGLKLRDYYADGTSVPKSSH